HPLRDFLPRFRELAAGLVHRGAAQVESALHGRYPSRPLAAPFFPEAGQVGHVVVGGQVRREYLLDPNEAVLASTERTPRGFHVDRMPPRLLRRGRRYRSLLEPSEQ